MSPPRNPLIEWHIAGRALAGESESGDIGLVAPFPGGALLAVIDGVGHGDEAAVAARTAADVLRRHPDAPVIWLVRECHQALLDTRGVVMSLAAYSAQYGTLAWIGVGNVEGLLLRADSASPARESLLLRGGGVGFNLPQLAAAVIPATPGDTLVFATDGVRSDFGTHLASPSEKPEILAKQILKQYEKGNDDALVLVAAFLGSAKDRP